MSRDIQYPNTSNGITIANYRRIDTKKLSDFNGDTVADLLFCRMHLLLSSRTVDLKHNPWEHGKIFNAAYSLGYSHVITGELAWIFIRDKNQTFKAIMIWEQNIFDMTEKELFKLLRPDANCKFDGSV